MSWGVTLSSFLWGFLCGIVTLVGAGTYVFIKVALKRQRKAGEDASSSNPEEEALTTAKILESLGIKADAIEKLAEKASVPAPALTEAPAEASAAAGTAEALNPADGEEQRRILLEISRGGD